MDCNLLIANQRLYALHGTQFFCSEHCKSLAEPRRVGRGCMTLSAYRPPEEMDSVLPNVV